MAGDHPTALAAGSRLALLERRRELVDGMPGVGGPLGMLLGSAGVSGLAALYGATQLREASFKIQSGSAGTMAFGVQGGVVMVILFAVLCLGSQALGAVGSWVLARNIKRRAASEAEVTKIDAELRALAR